MRGISVTVGDTTQSLVGPEGLCNICTLVAPRFAASTGFAVVGLVGRSSKLQGIPVARQVTITAEACNALFRAV